MPTFVLDRNILTNIEYNGTDLDVVVYNGTTVWEKLLYPVGTVVASYNIGNGPNTANLNTIKAAEGEPWFASVGNLRGGGNDYNLAFTLATGFYISRYTQSEHGTFSNAASNTGTSHDCYSGRTVSGLSGVSGGPGSGNDGSSFAIAYSGQP